MRLLIDGYNLMWAGNIVGREGRGTSLQRSRTALLELLYRLLPRETRSRTMVVFDASNAPPGLPKKAGYKGIHVRFADRREEADDVLIELIHSSTHARQLVVVSSDHRIQREARRRGATAIDSDEWLEQARRTVAEHTASADELKPLGVAGDTAYWIAQFSDSPASPEEDEQENENELDNERFPEVELDEEVSGDHEISDDVIAEAERLIDESDDDLRHRE